MKSEIPKIKNVFEHIDVIVAILGIFLGTFIIYSITLTHYKKLFGTLNIVSIAISTPNH